MSGNVLLLNADAKPLSLLPLSVISWQSAVKAYFQDKVRVLEIHNGVTLNSTSFSMDMPSVIMTKEFQRRPTKARFTRRHMYLRDKHQCQYCGNTFMPHELTIDHVIPRVMGGRTSWENCVSSCGKCNTIKGCKLIKPINEPHRPSWHSINNSKSYNITVLDKKWLQYLDWPDELVNYKPDLVAI